MNRFLLGDRSRMLDEIFRVAREPPSCRLAVFDVQP